MWTGDMIDVINHKLRLLDHWFLREKHFRSAAKSNWRSGGQCIDSRCNIIASAVTMTIPENEDFAVTIVAVTTAAVSNDVVITKAVTTVMMATPT
jgi:hypothetical protein